MKHVIGLLAVLACSKPKQQPIEMPPARVDAPIARPAVADARGDATPTDAAVSDAIPADAEVSDAIPADAATSDATPASGVPLDAAPRKRSTASKGSRRDACLKECERRNRYTDCGGLEGGMGPCPCDCP